MSHLKTVLALLFVVFIAAACSAANTIRVSVVDQQKQPIPGVLVELKAGASVAATAITDEKGEAVLNGSEGVRYEIHASKDGFEAQQSPLAPQLTLLPSVQHESVEVRGRNLDCGTQFIAGDGHSRQCSSGSSQPSGDGVRRVTAGSWSGAITRWRSQISGSAEHRSALIVNSADVTDPATGQFGLTVPIDSVDTLNVYQTPFLAEFGRFSAGVVSVQTRRGGEKWKWELNDPFPEFLIRSYQLRGVRTTTPRLNIEGPLIPGKLYFSEGFEYVLRKTPVYTLPFPENLKKQEGLNSFAQLDWIASAKQLVTATVHIAPQRLDLVNMNYFNPRSTAPDASTHNYTATVADRLTLHGGLLENTLSITRFDARVWAQGTADLVVTPQGNTGNYFAQQDRYATRIGWSPPYSFGSELAPARTTSRWVRTSRRAARTVR